MFFTISRLSDLQHDILDQTHPINHSPEVQRNSLYRKMIFISLNI